MGRIARSLNYDIFIHIQDNYIWIRCIGCWHQDASIQRWRNWWKHTEKSGHFFYYTTNSHILLSPWTARPCLLINVCQTWWCAIVMLLMAISSLKFLWSSFLWRSRTTNVYGMKSSSLIDVSAPIKIVLIQFATPFIAMTNEESSTTSYIKRRLISD